MVESKIIYIVDDSSDYLFLLQQVFTRFLSNCPVRFFTSGEALYECIQTEEQRPSVVLMDLNMPPGMGGYQTLMLLRKHPNWRFVPVVMMSNMASDLELRQCLEAGANSFLTKPTDIEEMQQTIGALCQYWLKLNRLPVGA